MKNLSVPWKSLLSALAVFVYVLLVVLLMNNAQQFFGPVSGIWAAVAMLLLLVLSVAAVGLLIFASPVMMYMEGQKQDSLQMLLWTVGWLVLLVIVVFGILFAAYRPTTWG